MLQQDGKSATDFNLRTEKVLQQDGKSATEGATKNPHEALFYAGFQTLQKSAYITIDNYCI